MSIILFTGTGFWNFEPEVLGKMGLFFLKAGAFVFGSGLAIVPFLHGGLVLENHWLTEAQFIDAVAVAMITPGPVVITVGFIGYLMAGFPGACLASLATFLPCYLFTVIPAPYFKKIAKKHIHQSICGWHYGGRHGCFDGICFCDCIAKHKRYSYISHRSGGFTRTHLY